MAYIVGVDIGNNTTEVAIAEKLSKGKVRFQGSSIVKTVGVKGTIQNAMGVIHALDQALAPLKIQRREVSLILLNEATPVIGDVAMETITETIITESAMIGHNPSTPGGQGLGLGTTIKVDELETASPSGKWVAIIPENVEFRQAADLLNRAVSRGIPVVGAIVQKDDGSLIGNRLHRSIPIVDEVTLIDRVPVGRPAAVEVAAPGRAIEKLSNPYDIATLFELSPEETRLVMPMARALTGTRSAVVIKTPQGDIQERRIPAGKLTLIGRQQKSEIHLEEGAEAIMNVAKRIAPLVEIQGEPGTHVGGMLENVRQVMAELTDQPVSGVRVQDILAVDTLKPQKVIGSLAGEYTMGNAVGLAAMVETHKLPMLRLARKLESELMIAVEVGGVEAEAAMLGALTTPGTTPPLAILDLGGGSTDASLMSESGEVRQVHLAGAGDMVTLLIDAELGLEDREMAENIKKYPLARVETLFNLRHEDGSVQFFDKPLDPRIFGRTVVLTDRGPLPVETREPLQKLVVVRQEAKKKSLRSKCRSGFGEGSAGWKHPPYSFCGDGGRIGLGF
jgi:diol dehydratase reactivase alpha subunit